MSPDAPAILWIGRMLFIADLRVREVELARSVSRRARVIALDRSDARGWGSPGIVDKLRLRYDLARGGWRRLDGGGIDRFRMPLMMATGPALSRLAAYLNERRIEQAVRRFGCGHVFHSSPSFFMPRRPGRRSYRAHFDLVDNFMDIRDSRVGRSRRRFLIDTMGRADTLSTISLNLCDRVEELIGRRPAYVPNGAALSEIASWPASRPAAVRERLGIGGCRVVAYIGNHIADSDGMGMLMDAFLDARRVRKDLAILVVGRGSQREAGARGLGPRDGVHVIGPVPTSEVWDYFQAADLGVLPFVLRPVTHDSLPLKVLEFGASRKPMLVTPLSELQRIGLPHVRFVPYDRDAWRAALLDDATYARPDEARLAAALRPFSWDAVGEALMAAMGI